MWNHWKSNNNKRKRLKNSWKTAEKMFWPAFGCAQHPKDGQNTQQVFGGAKRRLFCLYSHLSVCMSLCCLGTKGTLHTLPTLQNNEPVPQVLKLVVNLSSIKESIFKCFVNVYLSKLYLTMNNALWFTIYIFNIMLYYVLSW